MTAGSDTDDRAAAALDAYIALRREGDYDLPTIAALVADLIAFGMTLGLRPGHSGNRDGPAGRSTLVLQGRTETGPWQDMVEATPGPNGLALLRNARDLYEARVSRSPACLTRRWRRFRLILRETTDTPVPGLDR